MMNKCTRCGEVNPAEIHTCSPQTKAQRLAADLNLNHTYCPEEVIKEAAAELRRLDALNAELVDALNRLVKRDWQGLTDEELCDVCEALGVTVAGPASEAINALFRAIEAKLKEKNT